MTKTKAKTGGSTLEAYPEHVRAIGMISIENANLENAMGALFSSMLFISPRVGHAIYLTPKSAVARIEIFKNAAKEALRLYGDQNHQRRLRVALRKANRIADRAQSLIGKRHAVIHDAWGVDNEKGIIQRSPSISGRPETVSLAELERLIDDFRRLIDDICALQLEFKLRPPTLVNLRRK